MAQVRVAWYGPKIIRLTNAAAKRGVKKATFALIRNVDELIKIKGYLGFESQGRTAEKEGHTPGRSKPGEPPRMQTGVLRDNIVFEFSDRGHGVGTLKTARTFVGHGGGLVGRVGPDAKVPYGRALELGYKPNNLKPRPYLRPAFDKTIKNISQYFKGQLRR